MIEPIDLPDSVISDGALRPDAARTQTISFSQTGPKTPAGKRRSSLNRLSAGLYSNTIVTRGEDKDEYLRFARAIVADLDVHTALEMACAERIVSALWRSRRARRYEQAHLDKAHDEAERKREQLDRVQQELAKLGHYAEVTRRLSNCELMNVEELGLAASVLAEVFWDTCDADLPDMFWAAFPERGTITLKRLARIAETVREVFKPVHVADDSHGFWTWIGQRFDAAMSRLQRQRDEAADEYAKALRQTFLLDPTGGDHFDRERRAGRVLHDAERRLDRQVTQALADLESARRLRP